MNPEHWFTESCIKSGTAFSLRIKEKLHEAQTQYQKIEVYDTDRFGHLMVIDGYVMLTTRDNFIYHEMMSHPAIFNHHAPDHILIIGGGDCGTLKEVLKHTDIKSVTQVDIDEQVTRVSEQFFPELCISNHDPRAKLCFEDGIQWVKSALKNSYDIIIVDSTDPVGPAEGLFTESFYRDALNCLTEEGILVQQSESPLIHWKSITHPMQNAMLKAGFDQISTLFFPQCTYPSGWWSASMAFKDKKLTAFREVDCENKVFKTQYYNKAIHHAAMAVPEFLK